MIRILDPAREVLKRCAIFAIANRCQHASHDDWGVFDINVDEDFAIHHLLSSVLVFQFMYGDSSRILLGSCSSASDRPISSNLASAISANRSIIPKINSTVE